MPRHAIEVDHLSKRYALGQHAGLHAATLRESLSTAARRLVRATPARAETELWALRDVSFSVDEGEPLGVIGRNGAGKTTLLKILGRITEPTAGVARTKGRVGALLEVGTGFDPELTGRENVYLNGAILGMSAREVRRRFDEIVEFSGVGRFLDTPLKRYSTGMSLRLAFGVAAHLETEIVLVDEVLAVGDFEFQRKCLGKMSDLTGQGRTVVLVSHDLGAITRICRRAMWLEQGAARADGPSEEVVDRYLRSTVSHSAQTEFAPEPDKPVQLLSVGLADESGEPEPAPRRDKPLSAAVRFETRRRIPGLDVGFYLLNQQGVTVLHENWGDVRKPSERADEPGLYEASMTIPPLLPAGEYVLCVWIGRVIGYPEFETFVDQEAFTFQVHPRSDDIRDSIERRRIAQPTAEWRVSQSSPASRQ
jgi:ABC-type polysaccharide/polyol phosphate transport system ATPase subunit